MNVAGVSFRHGKAILLILVLLTLAGVYSAFRLPSGIYPEVNFPRIVIVATAGDLPTGNMLVAVTRPIEENISGVLGLYRVRSRTIRGEAELSLLFLPNMDMQLALQQVDAKVSEIRASLPPETQLTIERLTPAVFPVLSFNLTGRKASAADLHDYALYTIRPLLSRIRGVGAVRVLGDTVREIEVAVDPEKLLAYHLTLDQIDEAIRKANTIQAVGRLNKDYKQFLVLMPGQITDANSLSNIVVAILNKDATHPGGIVYLKDVATVFEGSEDKLMLISGNAEQAAQINVSRQIGGNILEIQKEAVQKIKELKGILPPLLKLSTVYDLAEFIQESIRSVRDAIMIGGILSVLILFFFLRDWRSTLIAATSIPVTLIITLFLMGVFHQTLNLMSLGGMAVAIGLVIDDAIVVIENIDRHIQSNPESHKRTLAVQTATNEILGAVAGSTFTTVVVFLPLALVQGVVGQFFAAFSITLSIAVLISLFVAFTLIPLLAVSARERPAAEQKTNRFVEWMLRHYERIVQKALGHTTTVIVVMIVLLGLGVFIYRQLGSGFLPTMDEGSFVLDYWLPFGTSLPESDRVIKKVEHMLKETAEVEAFSRRTGAELGLFATEQSRGDILVRLKPNRSRSGLEVMDDLRGKIEGSLPSLRIEFVQVLQDLLGDLEGSPEPVEVKLFGDDLNELKKRALTIAQEIEKIPGVVDLYNGVQQGNPELLIETDPTRLQKAGLDAEVAARQMSTALLGHVVTQIRQYDRLIGVRVRFPDNARFNPQLIKDFPLQPQDKTENIVPLDAIADLKEVNGQNELLRENQRQMIAVTSRISGTNLGDVIARVKTILGKVSFPPGYTYEIGGQYESQQNAFRQLLLVLFIAVMLIFILLVLQFREYAAALIVLSAAPVSLIGAFLILFITGTEFNVSSFMGLIMLIGLIVKNGIILIEYTFQVQRERNVTTKEAVVLAAKTRLRPILMTTLATLFGLLPLALGLGAGSELQKPLALAVIGGLSLSMLVTLIFVPVLLTRFHRSKVQQPAPTIS
jgi:CzcA family heavy metal efflux pump